MPSCYAGQVSTLNLDACQCAVLLDRSENEVTERRQVLSLFALLVRTYKHSHLKSSLLGTQFICFTSTKVQVLTRLRRQNKLDTSILPTLIQLRDAWATAGTQFTLFTGKKILAYWYKSTCNAWATAALRSLRRVNAVLLSLLALLLQKYDY